MDKKCTKYEGLFVFSDEETLNSHIEECEECRAEHEKMQKVSNLINEVKFHYKKKSKLRRARAACAAFLIFFSAAFYVADDSYILDTLQYGETLSAEDLGFPVDSYGLIMVD